MLRSNNKVQPEESFLDQNSNLEIIELSNSPNTSPFGFEEKGKEEEEEEETFHECLPRSNEAWEEDNVELGLQSESDDDSKFNSDSHGEMGRGQDTKSESSIGGSLSSVITSKSSSISSFDKTQLKKMKVGLGMWKLDLPNAIEKLFRQDFWRDGKLVSAICAISILNITVALDDLLYDIMDYGVTFLLISLFYIASAVASLYLTPEDGVRFVNWFLMPINCIIPIFIMLTSPDITEEESVGLLEAKLMWMMIMSIYCSWRRSIFFFTTFTLLSILSLVIVTGFNKESIIVIAEDCVILVGICFARLCLEDHLKGLYMDKVIGSKIEKEKNIVENCLHTLKTPILISNPNKTVTLANPSACKLLDLRQDEIEGKKSEIVVRRSAHVGCHKINHPTPEGTELTLEVEVSKMDIGTDSHFVTEISNKTEEEKLKDHGSEVVEILTQSNLGLAKVNGRGKVLTVYTDNHGKGFPDIKEGQHISDFFEKDCQRKIIGSISDQTTRTFNTETILDTPDVDDADYQVFTEIISVPSKYGNEALITLRNSSKEKNIEKMIERKEKEGRSTFIGFIFHEIRNPLNSKVLTQNDLKRSLIRLVRIMYERDPDIIKNEKFMKMLYEIIECMEDLDNQCDTMVDIISTVLGLEKVESSNFQLDMGWFNPSLLPKKLRSMLKSRFKEKNIDFIITFDKKLNGMELEGDMNRLKQVGMNFLTNAIKFTPSGGRVELIIQVIEELGGDKWMLRIGVRDSGVGISEEDLAKLFKPYSQIRAGELQGGGGTGLGLCLCKEVGSKHGGRVGVESKEGEGSFFFIDAVVSVRVPSIVEEKEVETAITTGESVDELRLLIIEDSLVARKRLVKYFKRVSYKHVDSAENGLIGVRKVDEVMMSSERMYDLIITDKEMPVMDGYEATMKMREMGVTCPIVGLTANAMEEQIEEFMSMGVDRVLKKPLEDDAMRNVEEDFLDIYRHDFWKKILKEDESFRTTILKLLGLAIEEEEEEE